MFALRLRHFPERNEWWDAMEYKITFFRLFMKWMRDFFVYVLNAYTHTSFFISFWILHEKFLHSCLFLLYRPTRWRNACVCYHIIFFLRNTRKFLFCVFFVLLSWLWSTSENNNHWNVNKHSLYVHIHYCWNISFQCSISHKNWNFSYWRAHWGKFFSIGVLNWENLAWNIFFIFNGYLKFKCNFKMADNFFPTSKIISWFSRL